MTLRVVVAASLDAGGPVFHESTHTGIDDLWDETITALLRAALHYDGVRPFAGYAHTAIHRACWRYVVRQAVKRPATTVLEDVDRECAVVGIRDGSRDAPTSPALRIISVADVAAAHGSCPPLFSDSIRTARGPVQALPSGSPRPRARGGGRYSPGTRPLETSR